MKLYPISTVWDPAVLNTTSMYQYLGVDMANLNFTAWIYDDIC